MRYNPESSPAGESKGGGVEGVAYRTDSNGNPNVFYINRNDDGKRWLNTNWVNPSNQWDLDNEIVFRLSNSFHFSPDFFSGEFCF